MKLFFNLSKFTWKYAHAFGVIILLSFILVKILSIDFKHNVISLKFTIAIFGYYYLFFAIPLAVIALTLNLYFLFNTKFAQYHDEVKYHLRMILLAFFSSIICTLLGLYLINL